MSQVRTDLLHLVEVLEGAERVDVGGKPALLIEGDLQQVLLDLPGLWLRAQSAGDALATVAAAVGLPATVTASDLVSAVQALVDFTVDQDDTNDDCPCSSCEVDHV